VFGHAVDKYGPKMGKAVMDGMLKAQKMGKPFAQAIEELQVPDEIKNDFASKVYSIASRMSSIESGPVSRIAERSSEADRQPARSQSGWMKWMQSGVKKLGLDPATSQSLMTSKEGQRLLIEASDLPAGSKRLNEIKMKLQGQGK
jgi:truncated hemoglobin YjbI